ncbi:N-acetylmuramoyl-L-alanine amidase [Sneathiella sp.]|uniref:N-acetylmuramoyl-L-alanine amidase n=1 Tax=Sneathiella sp. TaxID=1964365 RepID=UPI003568963B
MGFENSIWLPSPNFDNRDPDVPIDMLVLHYTGMPTAKAALDRLTEATSKVSAHYFVEENGDIFALVREEKRAWHAGVAFWRGERSINARSIGIEIVNPGHEFGYRPFPAAQMAAVTRLANDIVSRWAIKPWNVVGHSDVAPHRKEDPGELFDWKSLAEKNIGLWFKEPLERPAGTLPGPEPADEETLKRIQLALQDIGYECPPTGNCDPAFESVIRAFQRHWRPAKVDGVADAQTRAVVYAVQAQVPGLT